MTLQSSYLLVTHGSRDPRPQAALEKLAQQLYERLLTRVQPAYMAHLPLVGTATLEFGPAPLDEQIQQFARQTLARGLTQVQVLPLFLLPGVHVMEDIPEAVRSAQASPGGALLVEQRSHLGTHPGLTRLIANQMAELPIETWILLAHGSRRQEGNQPIEAMAAQLEALAAYWSVPPSLETRVEELAAAGYRQVGVLPYFLFAGSTTDAIAQAVIGLSSKFLQVKLELTTPLQPSTELVDLILDLLQLPAGLDSAYSLR